MATAGGALTPRGEMQRCRFLQQHGFYQDTQAVAQFLLSDERLDKVRGAVGEAVSGHTAADGAFRNAAAAAFLLLLGRR